MNTNSLLKHYHTLTPEERFRLILAASGRGDDVEQERLVKAGGSITLSLPDHAPYAFAFDEMSRLVNLELLDAAYFYLDAFARVDAARHDAPADVGLDDDNDDEEDDYDDDDDDNETGGGMSSVEERCLQVALAAGFMLREKAEGWKRFCARLGIPPFLLWRALPGFDRLQHALHLAEKAAFVPEGFLRWLNDVRPAGEPEVTAIALTRENYDDAIEAGFRQRAQWWAA